MIDMMIDKTQNRCKHFSFVLGLSGPPDAHLPRLIHDNTIHIIFCKVLKAGGFGKRFERDKDSLLTFVFVIWILRIDFVQWQWTLLVRANGCHTDEVIRIERGVRFIAKSTSRANKSVLKKFPSETFLYVVLCRFFPSFNNTSSQCQSQMSKPKLVTLRLAVPDSDVMPMAFVGQVLRHLLAPTQDTSQVWLTQVASTRAACYEWLNQSGVNYARGIDNDQKYVLLEFPRKEDKYKEKEKETVKELKQLSPPYLATTPQDKEAHQGKEKNHVVVDEMLVHGFLDLVRLPLPVTNPNCLRYYVNLMDPYFNCEDAWRCYTSSVGRFASPILFRQHVQLCTRMAEQRLQVLWNKYGKQVEQAFPAERPGLQKLQRQVQPGNFYQEKYADGRTLYASFDLVEANYQTIGHAIRKVDEKSSLPSMWYDFMAEITDVEIIRKSKPLRERIIGASPWQKLVRRLMSQVFVLPMFEYMQQEHRLLPVTVSDDELIYQLPADRRQFTAIASGNWRTQLFTLHPLGQRKKYYRKEFLDGSSQFRQVPKDLMCQAIRLHTNTPVTELDLLFTESQTKRLAKALDTYRF